MLSKEESDEECDATMLNSSNADQLTKNYTLYFCFLRHAYAAPNKSIITIGAAMLMSCHIVR
jgi:hypothetical protein